MPWDASDADRHHKGLSAKQKRQWSKVANAMLQTCLDKGGSQETCEGQAIRAANAAVNKSVDADALRLMVEARIEKADDSQQRLFGWASIAVQKDGTPLLDLQGDVIDIEDLEEAFYQYVLESGQLNFLHKGACRGQLIEAIVFTPAKLDALGLAPGSVPLGAWCGFYVPETADYHCIKSNGYFMFSIEGFAEREEV